MRTLHPRLHLSSHHSLACIPFISLHQSNLSSPGLFVQVSFSYPAPFALVLWQLTLSHSRQPPYFRDIEEEFGLVHVARLHTSRISETQTISKAPKPWIPGADREKSRAKSRKAEAERQKSRDGSPESRKSKLRSPQKPSSTSAQISQTRIPTPAHRSISRRKDHDYEDIHWREHLTRKEITAASTFGEDNLPRRGAYETLRDGLRRELCTWDRTRILVALRFPVLRLHSYCNPTPVWHFQYHNSYKRINPLLSAPQGWVHTITSRERVTRWEITKHLFTRGGE